MREILFRGKTEAGEWVQGDLSQHKTGKKFIKCGNAIRSYEVIHETVGQFTDLTDKNGKRIFEGDILRDIDGGIQTVIFDKGAFCGRYVGYTFNDNEFYINEVVGNTYDNPELLEVEQ